MIELVIGFIIGWVLSIWYLSSVIDDVIKNIRENSTSQKRPSIPTLSIEAHGDSLYLYDANDTFVTQAQTLDGIISNMNKYSDIKTAFIVLHDGETIYISEGSIAKRNVESA